MQGPAIQIRQTENGIIIKGWGESRFIPNEPEKLAADYAKKQGKEPAP